MSMLAALDATRICSRGPAAPDAWARPVPIRDRTPVHTAPFSWRSMARNPNALVVSAVMGTIMVRDALVRAVSAG